MLSDKGLLEKNFFYLRDAQQINNCDWAAFKKKADVDDSPGYCTTGLLYQTDLLMPKVTVIQVPNLIGGATL